MTQETAVLKDRALQDYYEALFELFAKPGWQMLTEDVSKMVEANDRTSGLDTAEQLWFRKGELSQMQWLLGLRERMEYVYNTLLAEQENAPEAAPTGGVAKIVDPNDSED